MSTALMLARAITDSQSEVDQARESLASQFWAPFEAHGNLSKRKNHPIMRHAAVRMGAPSLPATSSRGVLANFTVGGGDDIARVLDKLASLG